ncbi:MAG: hypothetical protein JXN64_00385 [Spirochaetes bacterium]|nr:hypothetical protein [Spirochaetota bacterium]
MDKSDFTNNNKIKTSGKQNNGLFLVINQYPALTGFKQKLNLNSIALKIQKSNLIPNNLYYFPWSSINLNSIKTIKNSFVMKLAKSVLDNIKSNNIINDKLYNVCLPYLMRSINDHELLLIYLKQFILIKNNIPIFHNADKPVQIQNSSYYIQFYIKLLNTFWNKTDWSLLFPSMPETAKKFNANKKLLIDLLLVKKDKFRIDSFANAFFRASNIGRVKDLLLTSFLDFSILTWLCHFGIINYISGSDRDPVFIEVTRHGKRMLEYLALE